MIELLIVLQLNHHERLMMWGNPHFSRETFKAHSITEQPIMGSKNSTFATESIDDVGHQTVFEVQEFYKEFLATSNDRYLTVTDQKITTIL